MTIKLMSVVLIDRGRARRACEAFTLRMVSPVGIDRQRGSPAGSVKRQSLGHGRSVSLMYEASDLRQI
jgi:hypothetical protein